MKDNIKEKVLLITDFIKINKRKILFFLFLMIVFLLLFIKRGDDNLDIATIPTPSPQAIRDNFSYIQDSVPKRDGGAVYLINRFLTLPDITGFAWDNKEIVYSTKNGIYKLWNNEQIIEIPIIKMSFSEDAQKAVIINNEGSFFVNTKTKESKRIDLESNFFLMSSSGNYILYNSESFINILNTENNQTKSLKLENGSDIDFDWITQTEKFYLLDNLTNRLNIYNYGFERLETLKIRDGHTFLSINPNNIIVTSNQNDIFIENTQTEQVKKSTFKDTLDLRIFWLKNNQIIVLERIDRELLGLYDQHIWLIEEQGDKFFIGNSVPITKKVDTNFKLLISNTNDAILLKENAGSLWIQSLWPELLPIYNENGLDFYNIPNVNKEGNH